MRRRAAHLIVMNADLCSAETFSIKWLSFCIFFWLLEFQRPYSLGTAWEIWLFHGSSQVCFFIFVPSHQGFLHSFSALPRPAMTSLWRRSSPRCTRRFVRHLPRLIYPARLLEFHYMHLWFELYFSFGHFTWCWRGSARRTSFAGLLAGISFKPHCLQTG